MKTIKKIQRQIKRKVRESTIKVLNLITFLAYTLLATEVLFLVGGIYDAQVTMAYEEPFLPELPATGQEVIPTLWQPDINSIPVITITPEPEPSHELDKARDFIKSKFPNSPLIDRIYLFDQGDTQKAKLALAIAGVESGFGTKGFIATNCQNAWGYLYPGTSMRGCYGQRWTSWDSSIPRYMAVADNWLTQYDGSKDSLSNFTGTGGYCQSACGEYINSLWYFLNQF